VKRDAISIVEAAYVQADVAAWLDGVVDAACPLLDTGYGLHAHAFRVHPEHDATTLTHVTWKCEPSSVAGMTSVRRSLLNQWPMVDGRVELLSTRPYTVAPWAGLISERMGVAKFVLTAIDPSGDSGIDSFGVLASNPCGDGVCVAANLPTSKRPSAATRRLWTMVAVHVAAGYRVVQALDSKVDAVLRPDGRIEHAEDDATSPKARASLHDASKAIDRARSRLRRARPEEAIELWRGLVDGMWSLVDHVDSDGKRFLFAKRNIPNVRPWHSLTEREQQVLSYAAEGHPHKLIGYELGISESTSARHLATAARKVGARSRLDLIRTFRASQVRT